MFVPPRPALLLVLAVAGCAGPPPSSDASGDASSDGSASCRSDRECTDGVFCNGLERCLPSDPLANAFGCVAPAPPTPCADGQGCDETLARCTTACSVALDADHDGHRAAACGGDDCDDADPSRFPGNPEVCAFTEAGVGAAHRPGGDHDEDCNYLTVASETTHDGDHDGDGHTDVHCSNRDVGGLVHTGDDCDDADAVMATSGGMTTVIAPESVHPLQTEACNGVDDNCDGRVDDGVARVFFPDSDHDNYGAAGLQPVFACAPPPNSAENSGDCADTDATVHPGALEACNGRDDDCNGVADDGAGPALLCAGTYGSPSHTIFTCDAGRCAVTCPANYGECNGALDDGCETDLRTSTTDCGACGAGCGVGGVCILERRGAVFPARCDSVVSVEAGADFTCVLRSSGGAVCWGSNLGGQLGDRSTVNRTNALPVVDLVGADALAVSHTMPDLGETHDASCAHVPGHFLCWGDNQSGELGTGVLSSSFAPTNVAFGTGTVLTAGYAVSLAIGGRHACAASAGSLLFSARSSEVYCWGANSNGQLGTGGGAVGGQSAAPVLAFRSNAVTGRVEVSAGGYHTCALLLATSATAGAVWCWGDNSAAQLGDGTHTEHASATVVLGATDYAEIDLGFDFSCGRTSGGQVRCWGNNASGQLGDGTVSERATPVVASGITNAVQVAVGFRHVCARLATGAVRCWGNNALGQLGDGTLTNRTTSVLVPGITDAVDVSVGLFHSCVLRSDQSVWCWGGNMFGALGDGSTTDSPTPVRVSVLAP